MPDGAALAPTASAFAPEFPIASAEKPLAPVAPVAPIAPIAPPAPSLEDVISRAIPAIVSIEAGQGRGSGFFAAPRTVITNRHVIQNNVSVTVRLSNGQTLPGRVETSSTEYRPRRRPRRQRDAVAESCSRSEPSMTSGPDRK